MAELASFIEKNTFFTPTRIPSLYSNFSHLKELNPDGFDANIDAWGALLSQILRQGVLPSSVLSIPVEGPNFAETLALNHHGSPKGLETILEELVSRHTLVPLSHYRTFKGPFNAPNNLKNYVSPSKWLLWGVLALRGPFRAAKLGVLVPENYLSWDNLNTRGQQILSIIRKRRGSGYSSCLFDEDLLLELIRKNYDQRFSATDLLILLIFFARDIGVATTANAENSVYIKFGEKSSITEDDVAIIKLEASIRHISLQNSELEHRLHEELPVQISHILHQKQVDQKTTDARIKGVLLHKRALSGSLQRSSDLLARLESVLLKINDASTNVDAFRILRQSSGVLKTLNEMVNVDEVDEIQAQLDEEFDKTKEICDSMVRNAPVEDDELDKELEALYTQETGKAEAAEKERNKAKEEHLLKKIETLSVHDEKGPNEDRKIEQEESMLPA